MKPVINKTDCFCLFVQVTHFHQEDQIQSSVTIRLVVTKISLILSFSPQSPTPVCCLRVSWATSWHCRRYHERDDDQCNQYLNKTTLARRWKRWGWKTNKLSELGNLICQSSTLRWALLLVLITMLETCSNCLKVSVLVNLTLNLTVLNCYHSPDAETRD